MRRFRCTTCGTEFALISFDGGAVVCCPADRMGDTHEIEHIDEDMMMSQDLHEGDIFQMEVGDADTIWVIPMHGKDTRQRRKIHDIRHGVVIHKAEDGTITFADWGRSTSNPPIGFVTPNWEVCRVGCTDGDMSEYILRLARDFRALWILNKRMEADNNG